MEKKCVMVRLKPETKQRFHAACIMTGEGMNEVLEKLVEEWLKAQRHLFEAPAQKQRVR